MKALSKVGNAAIIPVEHFGDGVIDKFIASRHASENTAKTYRNALRQMLKYFAANGITEPSESDVDSYVESLKAAGKSPATLRLYTTCAKSFFSFTARRGIYRDVAADVRLNLRKATTHAKRALTNAQAQKLLATVTGDDVLAVRDRAIIALALTCGLRTCEISRADVKDLRDDGRGGFYFDVQGKGRLQKDATVVVAPAVAKLVDAYLNLRGDVGENEPLFLSQSNQNRGVRLSVQSVGKMIQRRMKAAGVYSKRSVTAHSTRHFAATQAIRAGVDVREVSQMLRHASLNVTMVYLHDLSVESRVAETRVADSLFGGAVA